MTPLTAPEQFERFGPLLRYLRVRAQLSQRALALAVGYSEAHLSRLEQGQRRPDPDAVRAHFLPALDLERDTRWAARLLSLAVAEHAALPSSGVSPARPQHTSTSETVAPSAEPVASLLTTKLYRPPQRPNSVRRVELLARLDAILVTPLTLVLAPAGFGKSSLVSAWLEEVQRLGHPRMGGRSPSPAPPPRGAWLSLDAGDNDPTVFVRYLAAALGTAAPGSADGALTLLDGPQPPPLAALVTALVNGLAALPHEGVLVLDDYHSIVAPAIHDLLAALLERLPPRLHVVITARSEPPLPLARMRARGQLLELRATALRFHADEAEAFLRTTMGLSLEAGTAAALAAHTEGWVAGLQLAGMALREEADPAAFVAAFTGTNRYVLDYLLEEVFARLPAHLQRFLLQTSVLERLSGPICDAVLGVETQSGDSYSQLLLRELEQRQLFLVPLDTEWRWYRYHHLFAEAMRARLREGLPAEQIEELYRRAAFAEPSPERSVGYLLDGQLWNEAGARIEALGEALLAQGEHITLQEWLGRLPAPERTRPRLQLLHGIASARQGQAARAEASLAAALEGSRAQGDLEVQGMALTELALLALIRGEAHRSLERFEQARTLPAPPHLRAQTLLYATGVYLITDRLEELESNTAELLALLGHSDDPRLLIPFLLGANALVSGVFSQLTLLEQLCRRGLALLTTTTRLPGASAQAALALIAWQRGHLDEALQMSEQVLAAWERVGAYGTIAPQMLCIAAGVATVRGDLERAAEILEEALRQAHEGELYAISRPGLLYALARVRWQQGRPEAVRRLAAEVSAGSSPRFGAFTDVIGALTYGLADLAEGALDRAEAAFGEVAGREGAVGLMPAFGSAYPLRAHLELAAGRPERARVLLEPLLTRCARDDTPGRLLFEGPYIVPLLRLAVAGAAPAPIATRTLAIWEAQQLTGRVA